MKLGKEEITIAVRKILDDLIYGFVTKQGAKERVEGIVILVKTIELDNKQDLVRFAIDEYKRLIENV